LNLKLLHVSEATLWIAPARWGGTPASPEQYTLMATDTRDQADAIESEIRAVRLALEHYRAGLDVEKSVSAREAE